MLDQVPSLRAVELAAELQELGYSAIWIPEAVGRDPFVMATLLLQGTDSITVATGIANIYARDPMTMANAQRTIEEAHPGRFLLGLGVSHRHLVQDLRNHEYSRPVSYMREYLARMSEAPFLVYGPQDLPELVLAALGPRMLRLAAEAAAGAHPYFVPPEHTATARQIMGPDAALYPEQMVILDTDPAAARALARRYMSPVPRVPELHQQPAAPRFRTVRHRRRPGGGPLNRLVDAIVAWGTPEQIARRVQQHFDAGADGGFKWSSQHLDVEVCDGQAVGVVGDADGETGDEVAGASADSSGCGAGVLGEDRRGAHERGRGDRVRGVGSRRDALVPRTWGNANSRAGSVDGALPVLQ